MTELIEWLCRRMLEAGRIGPDGLAAEIGGVQGAAAAGLPIVVAPRDRQWGEARVIASPETGEASDVILRPAGALTVGELSAVLGPAEESPRLHPDRPRKLVFSPARDAEHSYDVRVIAEVAADGAPTMSTRVDRVIVTRARAAEKATETTVTGEPAVAAPWARLLGSRATFGVRSWRAATLDSVRAEVERALGVRLVPSSDKVYDGAPAFECAMPACELRLNGWAAPVGQDLFVFNLIGGAAQDLDGAPAERISDAVAAHLRSGGADWYVPDRLELLEEGGVLGERQLDRDVIAAIVAARWLAFAAPAAREVGVQLLESIVDSWLTSARRARDPAAELAAKRRELEEWGKGVAPERRVDILASYALHEQLTVIEAELFEMSEQLAGGGARPPSMQARLAELRAALPALRDAAHRIGVGSIARQYDRVAAALDRLASAT